MRIIIPEKRPHEHEFNLRIMKPNELGYHGMAIRWCTKCGKTDYSQRDFLGHFAEWKEIRERN